MYCPFCKSELPQGARFCINCQNDIPEESYIDKNDSKISLIDLRYRGIRFTDITSSWSWALNEVEEDISAEMQPWLDNGWKTKTTFLKPDNLTVVRGGNWKRIGLEFALDVILRTERRYHDTTDHTICAVTGAKIPMVRVNSNEKRTNFFDEKNWYGFKYHEIDNELKDIYKISYNNGLFVLNVTPESPAEKAGLGFGDVICSANDIEITKCEELDNLLLSPNVVIGIQLNFFRKGTKYKAKVFPDFPPWL